jgi:hypothetical protein
MCRDAAGAQRAAKALAAHEKPQAEETFPESRPARDIRFAGAPARRAFVA